VKKVRRGLWKSRDDHSTFIETFEIYLLPLEKIIVIARW